MSKQYPLERKALHVDVKKISTEGKSNAELVSELTSQLAKSLERFGSFKSKYDQLDSGFVEEAHEFRDYLMRGISK